MPTITEAQAISLLIAQAWDAGVGEVCNRHSYMVLCTERTKRLAEWLVEHGVRVTDGGDSDDADTR